MVTAQAPTSTAPREPTEQERVYDWFLDQYWSEEAYLAVSEASNHLMELSDGRLVILPMPTLTHQNMVLEFAHRARDWLQQNKVGQVAIAPHPIRLWPGKYREPDVMIWLSAHLNRMGEKESGPPDLVLEIHSPTTTDLDTTTKFTEYASAGIPEYWLADPESRRVSVYTLEGRRYSLLAHFGPGERARSAILPGFEIAVDDLFSSE